MAFRSALGQQVHLALVEKGPQAASDAARLAGQPDLFARVSAVATEAPTPNFLHSALCAMSLPVRRPPDEHVPIIRQDGQYTLVINPKPRVELVDGQQRLRSLGVPFGSLPRIILIHVMTEAVRTRSRQIVLGKTFTEWMRRLGYQTISYGPRGSATLIRDQLDRLLACEWMIRWDGEIEGGTREFGIQEIKLTNQYVGQEGANGAFLREMQLTEPFFEHLREHAVPLNEVAIRQLRDFATALDLYTWLAYRLPRIGAKRAATLSWQQLAVHFGNDGKNIRKFRQTIRDAWERLVSGVYPEARADFDTTIIRLYPSPAPLQQKLIPGASLKILAPPTDANGTPAEVSSPGPVETDEARFLAALQRLITPADFRSWFRSTRLVFDGGQPVLLASSSFVASHLRAHFALPLRRAAESIGLGAPVEIVFRNQA